MASEMNMVKILGQHGVTSPSGHMIEEAQKIALSQINSNGVTSPTDGLPEIDSSSSEDFDSDHDEEPNATLPRTTLPGVVEVQEEKEGTGSGAAVGATAGAASGLPPKHPSGTRQRVHKSFPSAQRTSSFGPSVGIKSSIRAALKGTSMEKKASM